MLDQRLSLAASMFDRCKIGADIGTDHGLLPCHLLERGICDQMILADISMKALNHARSEVNKRKLEDRAQLICADGLQALTSPCEFVSLLGMGGKTQASILEQGESYLAGATLILSANTELPVVRRAIANIGYRITREELCECSGRFYIVWRAEPGKMHWSEEEYLTGKLLYLSNDESVRRYVARRIAVLDTKLRGLFSAKVQNEADIVSAKEAMALWQIRLESLK